MDCSYKKICTITNIKRYWKQCGNLSVKALRKFWNVVIKREQVKIQLLVPLLYRQWPLI